MNHSTTSYMEDLGTSGLSRVLVASVLAWSTGCGSDRGLDLEPLSDQEVAVGQRLTVWLTPVEKAAGRPAYHFTSSHPGIEERGTVATDERGVGVFEWDALAGDVGQWTIGFGVRGGDEVLAELSVVVTDAADEGAPRFLLPNQLGISHDITSQECLTVPIEVDDLDTAEVELAQQEPVIPGATLFQADGNTAELVWCPDVRFVKPGDVFVATLSADDGEHPKTIIRQTILVVDGTTCVDGLGEEDDDMTSARRIAAKPSTILSDRICPWDDDWYAVEVSHGDTLRARLRFDQTTPRGDLDLHIVDSAGVDLTPCSEADPSLCDRDRGQSATADEAVEQVIDNPACAPCTWYVVVHGWNGADNHYELQVDVEPGS
jgi:hypothetical protein